MYEPSVRQKVVTLFGSLLVTVEYATGSTSGKLSPSSAGRVADAVLGIVRGHDEDRAEQVVDASICCDHEHLPDDREVALMAAILRGMRWLDKDAQQRIRSWVDERFVRTEPPF